jgi:hypothetical protein
LQRGFVSLQTPLLKFYGFTGIEDLQPNANKKLQRITDLNGKETPFRKNTVLIFIYEDGTIERVFKAE